MIKKTKHHLLLPFYHSVSDEVHIHIKNLYQPRSVSQFNADLDFLLENYKSISLERLIEINKSGEEVRENYFHLTFDDGLSEFYTTVAPILKERNIHATVFLNTDFIDNKALFYRFKASILHEELKDDALLSITYNESKKLDELALKNSVDFSAYLKNQQPYLTSEQIRALINDGFTFGAHSLNHPLYKGVTGEQQLIQTKESIEIVTAKFNLDYKVFSFPFTDDGVSKKVFKEIDSFSDMTFGCAGIKEDSANNHLQRVSMEMDKSGEAIIKAEYLYALMKQKMGKNKVVRQ
ncbi:MAG: polysaccharide deacetylase family protein [Flavobacteriales bacterium]|nr:polysaccharide deacetylase family protein [Flavobacteriales bacterium]